MPSKNRSNPSIHSLDAEKDINHWTFRVPGLIVWTVILGFIFLMVRFPNAALEFARVVGFYGLLRLVWYVIFYIAALVKMDRKDREVGQRTASQSKVHHLVLIPIYKEPVEVVARSLDSIAAACGARDNMTVVLAMEARDPTAQECSASLYDAFHAKFAHMLVTFHPSSLPGEIPCKASNLSWAVRIARAELVDNQHLAIDQIIVTPSDADSVFHPAYFDEVGKHFEADPRPHNRIWHAPILLDTNIWKVPTSIRLFTYFLNAIQLSEHTNPLSFIMPYSTYSLSLRMAEQVGYWDPAVISEDYHIFMRCMFALRGNLKVVSIFLPIHGEVVSGSNSWNAWLNCYRQKVRHAWGIEDLSYLLQQWNKNPGTPLIQKTARLSKMFFDHIFVAFLPVIIILGSALAISLRGEPILTVAHNYAFPPIVLISNGLSVVASIVIWIVEHARCARTHENWSLRVLASELVTWLIMPVFSMFILFLPDLHAQTKMLVASPLVFIRTTKGLDMPQP